MSNTVDIITCDQPTFLKYLEENKLKEVNFEDMFSKFHENYIQVAKEIRDLNDKRCEILLKIRSTQLEYKRLLGHGDIKPVIDANDEDDNEETNVQEQKTTDKRGRKKVVAEKQPEVVQEEDEDAELEELENIPKMKTKANAKAKKETKQTTNTKIEDEVVEEEELVIKKKVPAKKTSEKNVTKKEVKEEVKEEVEEQPVVKTTTKATKGKILKKIEETEKIIEPANEEVPVDKSKKIVAKKKVK